MVREGERPGSIQCVVGGSVAVNVVNDTKAKAHYTNAHEQFIADIVEPGGWFGILELYGFEHDYRMSVIARADCQTASIPYAKFERLLQTELKTQAGEIAVEFNRYLVRQYQKNMGRLIQTIAQSTEARVWNVLQDLTKTSASTVHPMGHKLNYKIYEIAWLAGVGREHTGRVMKSLQKQKKIARRGHSIIVSECAQ